MKQKNKQKLMTGLWSLGIIACLIIIVLILSGCSSETQDQKNERILNEQGINMTEEIAKILNQSINAEVPQEMTISSPVSSVKDAVVIEEPKMILSENSRDMAFDILKRQMNYTLSSGSNVILQPMLTRAKVGEKTFFFVGVRNDLPQDIVVKTVVEIKDAYSTQYGNPFTKQSSMDEWVIDGKEKTFSPLKNEQKGFYLHEFKIPKELEGRQTPIGNYKWVVKIYLNTANDNFENVKSFEYIIQVQE